MSKYYVTRNDLKKIAYEMITALEQLVTALECGGNDSALSYIQCRVNNLNTFICREIHDYIVQGGDCKNES